MKTDQNLMPFETALETIARLTQEKHSAEADAARLRGLLEAGWLAMPRQSTRMAAWKDEVRAALAAGPLSAGGGEG